MKMQPSHDYNNNDNEIAKATHLPCPMAKERTIFMRVYGLEDKAQLL
jgi:hypothetical protein